MRATCPKCEERIEKDAAPNRMVSVTCPTCGYQFYTKSPKTTAGSGASSSIVPPAAPRNSGDDELKLAPETPPSRYKAPPSLPESVRAQKFDLGSWIRSAGSWVAVIGLITAFGALGLSVIIFAPQFVEVAEKLPAPTLFPPSHPADDPNGVAARPKVSSRKASGSESSKTGNSPQLTERVGAVRDFFFPREHQSPAVASTSTIAADDLLKEYVELQEHLIDHRKSLSAYGTWEINEHWKLLEQADVQSRALLERALAMHACPHAIAAKYRAQLQTVNAQLDALATSDLDELTPPQQVAMRRAFSDQAILKRAPHVRLLQQLMRQGFAPISDDDEKREPFLTQQIHLFRELNAALIKTDSVTDLSLVAPRLEAAADEMIELASKRSGNRETKSVEQLELAQCAETQRMLTFRILRLAEDEFVAPRIFTNAAINFYAADELYSVARSFSPEELRQKMSDARRQQQGFGPQTIPSLTNTMKSGSYWARSEPQPPQVPSGTSADKDKGVPLTFERLSPSGPMSNPVPSSNSRAGRLPGSRGTLPGFSIRRPRPPFSSPPRGIPNANRNRYAGTNGARIFFAKPSDPTETAKRWVKQLDVPGWSMTTSGGQCELNVPWGGTMESLAEKFGRDRVVEVNNAQRWIRVRLTE